MNKKVNSTTSMPNLQRSAWLELTPGERLTRSWELRKRIKNLAKVHDKKLFPKP